MNENKLYKENDQGKKTSQLDFSQRMVDIGYFSMIIGIIIFMIYEWVS